MLAVPWGVGGKAAALGVLGHSGVVEAGRRAGGVARERAGRSVSAGQGLGRGRRGRVGRIANIMNREAPKAAESRESLGAL